MTTTSLAERAPARAAETSIAARPSARAVAEPVRRARTAAMSDELRRAIRAHAQHHAGAAATAPVADIRGLFGQAINAGIHDVSQAAGGAGGALDALGRDPLAALGDLAGNALGSLGDLAGNALGAGGGSSGPLAALGGLVGNAAGGVDTATSQASPRSASEAAGPAPPPLAALRASLPTNLQRELDGLARSPEGRAAIAMELRGAASGGSASDPARASATSHGAAPATAAE